MTDLITGYVIGEALNTFKKYVVRKARNKREENFINSFLEAYPEELRDGKESSSLDDLFEKISSSETSSEMLFEVYRKVCLSASKSLGPKVLGILAAKICSEDRVASNSEELIFESIQDFNDLELREIVKFFESIKWWRGTKSGKFPFIHRQETLSGKVSYVHSHKSISNQKYYYEIELGSFSTFGTSDYEEVVSRPSLTSVIGTWSVKLKNYEILEEETIEISEYNQKSKTHDQTERKFIAKLNKEYIDLIVPLINRATGPKPEI